MINPTFFDIFGTLGFIIILIIGILIKSKKRKLSNNALNWVGIILILIATLGLVVDVTIVIKSFLLK